MSNSFIQPVIHYINMNTTRSIEYWQYRMYQGNKALIMNCTLQIFFETQHYVLKLQGHLRLLKSSFFKMSSVLIKSRFRFLIYTVIIVVVVLGTTFQYFLPSGLLKKPGNISLEKTNFNPS